MLQSVTPGLHMYIGAIGTNKKVAGFDLDWTIVRTVRGRFPKDDSDWAFLPNRISILRKYQQEGYTLAIFTNQGYSGVKLATALRRIGQILTALLAQGINAWIFVAAGANSPFRKPASNMWTYLTQYFVPNVAESFYVGDAAGRPQDHSADDRGFATGIGIPFHIPEEIFPNNSVSIPDTQTMFILVGMPGSGKSYFYEHNLLPKRWVHASSDLLGTNAKVLNTVRNALANKQSVAVDATNPSLERRREYLNLAIQYQVPTMIIYFVRNGYDWNKLRPKPVPDVAYNMYYKNLIEPSLELDGVPVVEIA